MEDLFKGESEIKTPQFPHLANAHFPCAFIFFGYIFLEAVFSFKQPPLGKPVWQRCRCPSVTAHKAYLLISPITCLLTPFLPGFLHISPSQPPLLLLKGKKNWTASQKSYYLKDSLTRPGLSSKLVQAFAPLLLPRHRLQPRSSSIRRSLQSLLTLLYSVATGHSTECPSGSLSVTITVCLFRTIRNVNPPAYHPLTNQRAANCDIVQIYWGV